MKVAHVRDKTFTVYIGRPSIFGNPYIIGKDGDRKTVIRKFKKYALRTDRVLNAIKKLPRHAILGCHCTPKACHGDVIIRIHKSFRAKKKHAKQ